jgi:hypothetical protein
MSKLCNCDMGPVYYDHLYLKKTVYGVRRACALGLGTAQFRTRDRTRNNDAPCPQPAFMSYRSCHPLLLLLLLVFCCSFYSSQHWIVALPFPSKGPALRRVKTIALGPSDTPPHAGRGLTRPAPRTALVVVERCSLLKG